MRTRRSAVAAQAFGVAWLIAMVVGCHARLPKLARQGEYGEVIRRAQRSRFKPRRAAARAYAEALVDEGDLQRAMAVLLGDYRRGGEYASLILLADLERAQGWRSLAAHHYARVDSLDGSALAGRGDVCDLFEDRARAYLSAREGVAADRDVRRAFRLCPGRARSLRTLALRTQASAAKLVAAQSSVADCAASDCQARRAVERVAADEADLRTAAAVGPAALYRAAIRLGAQLPPKQVADVMLAEYRGELGASLLPDAHLQGMLGAQTWSDLAATVIPMPPADSAYLQLKLSAVLSVPVGPKLRNAVDPVERWADRAVDADNAKAWRLHVWRGDPTTAELALSARWRPKPKPRAGVPSPTHSTADPAPSESASSPPIVQDEPVGREYMHWSAAVPIDSENLDDLLAIARLRSAAGKEDLALQLLLAQLDRAEKLSLDGAAQARVDEATRALGWGRPWLALALVADASVAEAEPVRSSAATAVLLQRITCGGACRGDDDEATVTRVLGEAWIAAQGQELLAMALSNRTGAGAPGPCPSAEEYLAPDAQGAVASFLRASQDEANRDRSVGTSQAVLASDLRPWCAAEALLPIALSSGAELWPGTLAESLAHAPQMVAARELLLHAKLSILADEPRRAQQMIVAAAGEAADPGAVWAEFAEFATAAGSRELAMEGWRETILHSPGLTHDGARRELLLAALEDAGRSWTASKPVGREALKRQVEEYLSHTAPARRWSAMEDLLAQLHVRKILDRAPAEAVIAAMLPSEEERLAHTDALAVLRGGPKRSASTEFDDVGLAQDAEAGRLSRPPELTVLFARPEEFWRLRTALGGSARDWETRRRMALGLAVVGTPAERRAGLRVLAQMASAASPTSAARLNALLLQRPTALQPTARVSGLEPVPLVAGTGELVSLVLGRASPGVGVQR